MSKQLDNLLIRKSVFGYRCVYQLERVKSIEGISGYNLL